MHSSATYHNKLGPCTQAPNTDVLAKQTDTLRVLRKILLNIQNNRI